MTLSRIKFLVSSVVVLLLIMAFLAPAALAADNDAVLRERALKLNTVTGTDPIEGQILTLTKDAEATRKLLGVAVEMAKGKNQPFNINAVYILARTAHALKESAAAEALLSSLRRSSSEAEE